MSKTFRRVVIFIVVAAVIGVVIWVGVRARSSLGGMFETQALTRGDLTAKIDMIGYVRPYQSVTLVWKTSGQVEEVLVELGEEVEPGQILASLAENSLPSHLIQSKANLIEAQENLEILLETQSQRAQALKVIEGAERALENALNPEMEQAEALVAVAQAREVVDQAELNYELAAKSPTQDVIDQAYANMIVAENQLAEVQDQVDQLYRRLNRPLPWYADMVNLDKSDLRQALRGMEYQLSRTQLRYQETVEKYNNLVTPPDPVDVAQASAELETANAQLEDAERQYEEAMEGPTPAEIALLEAELADAQREYERVKDGPPEEDIAALEAQIAAAQAGLELQQLTAPFGGSIVELNIQEKDRVDTGTFAVRIDDRSHLYVDLQVSEMDINILEIGQQVEIRFESMPGQIYHGEVVEIGMVGVTVLNDTKFSVSVEVLDADQRVKPGMTAVVDITIAELEDVLLVPNRAVRVVDNERVVYTLESGLMPNPVPFELGYSSGVYSQMLESELEEGDMIILNPPSTYFQDAQGPPPFVRERP